jgi:hypothetical protein
MCWRFFVTIFFCSAIIEGEAQILTQDSSRLFFAGLSLHKGIIVTQPRLKPFAKSKPAMVQLDFSFINNTQQSWSQCNCYSKTGLSVSYVDFKNKQVLGEAFNLAVYTEPYLYYSPRFRFSLRGGTGFSYLTNVHDVETNPENLFFSSPVSFLLELGLAANFKISPAFDVSVRTQFSHISNGGTRYPNWGINFPTVAVGVDYQINQQKLISRERIKLDKYPFKLILCTAGGRHLEDGTKKIVGQINGGLIKQVSRVNGAGVGAELVYDAINKVLEERKGVSYRTIVASLSLQHYFFYGKLLFGQQLAYYVVSPNSNANQLYQVYTLEYEITRQWYGGVLLRAHGGISDYLALSITKVITLKR